MASGLGGRARRPSLARGRDHGRERGVWSGISGLFVRRGRNRFRFGTFGLGGSAVRHSKINSAKEGWGGVGIQRVDTSLLLSLPPHWLKNKICIQPNAMCHARSNVAPKGVRYVVYWCQGPGAAGRSSHPTSTPNERADQRSTGRKNVPCGLLLPATEEVGQGLHALLVPSCHARGRNFGAVVGDGIDPSTLLVLNEDCTSAVWFWCRGNTGKEAN